MMENNEAADIRKAAVSLLEQKGYKVTNLAKGSGSPPFSRIEATHGTETLICSIKAVTKAEGRIHFVREEGEWKVLRKVDHVLHAWRDPGHQNLVRVSLFDAQTVLDAFEANYAAKEKEGKANIPCWISPEFEAGWRFVGSGFGAKALWRETVPLIAAPGAVTPLPGPAPASDPEMGIMERIKLMLSEHMGVPAERIEVDVRVKL